MDQVVGPGVVDPHHNCVAARRIAPVNLACYTPACRTRRKTRPNRRRREPGECGEVTASAVVIVPLVMIIMFAIVQTAIGWYAQAALNAAAEDGLRSAQTNATNNAVPAAQASIDGNAGFVSAITITTTTPTPVTTGTSSYGGGAMNLWFVGGISFLLLLSIKTRRRLG